MTTKADFTPEEWSELIKAPMTVTMYIVIASPSVFGSVKEAYATAKSIAKITQESTANELLSALAADFKDKETAKQARPELESKDANLVKGQTLDALRQVAGLLDQKATPEEAAEIKQWLYQVGVDTANAAKEGGFLGIGAVRVSESEKAALQDLASVFGVEPS